MLGCEVQTLKLNLTLVSQYSQRHLVSFNSCKVKEKISYFLYAGQAQSILNLVVQN